MVGNWIGAAFAFDTVKVRSLDPKSPVASNARTLRVYVPFGTVVLSNVQSAGDADSTSRSTLFTRNSIRETVPVTVAWKVTVPLTGEVTGATVTSGPLLAFAGSAEKSSNVTAPENCDL